MSILFRIPIIRSLKDRRARPIAILFSSLLLIPVMVFSASSILPGGTAISVTISTPSDGAEFVLPDGSTMMDVSVTGTAEIAQGVADPDTTLIYVLDGSGSTGASAGGDCGPDQNPGDPEVQEDEIIDCEIAATINLNNQAISLGSVDEVAMIMFAGDAVTADATPGGGDDSIVTPGANANSNSQLDVDEVLHSIRIAEQVGDDSGFWSFTQKNTPNIFGTNYASGISAALSVAAVATNGTKLVVFVSDGLNGVGADVDTLLPSAGGEIFHTFAVGTSASCTSGSLSSGGPGSLQDVADLTGGTCTEVSDPTQLPSILPELIQSELVSLSLRVDGGAAVAIDNSGIDPDLPQNGPASVTYQTLALGLEAGGHEICVTADGTDAGGAGSVTDCNNITISQHVAIDIKPTSCPNPLNVGAKGVLPVAILGAADLDVTQVDVSSIRLAGVSPLRSSIEDVATPYDGPTEPVDALNCTESGPDGINDLSLKFNRRQIAQALGVDVVDRSVLYLQLTGSLTDGTPITGKDVIVVINK